MAHQSPMVSIPKKTTEEVDWTTPIRNLIAQSYGENPDNYAQECAALQRCRQDAVRGAGSDMTARDLLYKYFGQLELLELRFSEIRVNFPWHDAFTNKLVTQTSIAYEKASILFQIAVTHSSIASSQSRSDPEGLKRAFYYFRACAGMLTYINENFLHAPSTDLSREVIKFLVNLILAQASEVFFEKCTDEKKGNLLVSKVGSQVASMYTSLSEEVKEFMGKGIFDRNWVTLIQIKAKYFTSLAQYYRGLADNAAGKHGDALVRFTVAETTAKEASRSATSFSLVFVTQMSPNLPPDAGSSIQDRTKAHLALVSDRKTEAQRENDLIYNAVLPSADALPPIDKTAVASPIPIQEIYGTPDVQKVIGQDLFIRLIPLSVHESASVYSEEKAKLVRGEVEKAEAAEGEVRSALDALGVNEGIVRFKAMAEGEVGSGEIPVDVKRWKEDITVLEEQEPVEQLLAELNKLKDNARKEVDDVSRDLEIESKDCEMMRVKYDHLWTQAPSASLTKTLRQDLKSHIGALEAAAASDQQVLTLWNSVKGDVALLMSPDLEEVFRASTDRSGSTGESLLDLDIGADINDEQERTKVGQYVEEIEERLGRLNKISRERNEVLKDLKEKVQTDDVSHLLLLNRRNSGVEPSLFAAELEKFRPYQQRLASTVHHQQATVQEITSLWKTLKDLAGRGPGARKWEEREKRKRDTVRRFSRARDGYMEVRDGIAKGLQFYRDLIDLTVTLRRNVKAFVSSRNEEREALSVRLETERRLSVSAATAPPPLAEKPRVPPPPPSAQGLDTSFGNLNLRGGPTSPPPQWNGRSPPPQSSSYVASPVSSVPPPPPSNYFPPPSQYQQSHYPPPVPPPQTSPPPVVDPYASLAAFSSQYAAPSAPPQQQPPPQQHYPSPPPRQPSYPQAPPPQPRGYSYNAPQQPQYGGPPPGSAQSPFPPPPPPVSYNYGSNPQPQRPGSYSQYPPPPPGQGSGYSQGYGR